MILVTYNSAAELRGCLTTVRPAPELARVIVVDNASADGSAQEARTHGADVVIENSENEGFARAVNRGLREATAEQVLLLNPDARVAPHPLARLCLTLATEPTAAVVAPLLRRGGRVTAGAGRQSTAARRVALCVPVAGRSAFARSEYDLPAQSRNLSRAVDVGYVYGAAMLLDRGFLTDAGGLDERFFLFAEDEDLCRRARAAGRRVLLEGRAVADHVGGANCPDPAATEAQRLFSTWLLLQKWNGRRAAATYHRGVLSAFRVRQARRGARSREARHDRPHGRAVRGGSALRCASPRRP